LGRLLLFDNTVGRALLSVVLFNDFELLAREGVPKFGTCTSIRLFGKAQMCCVGFFDGHIALCHYQKLGSIDTCFLKVHQHPIVCLLRLSGEHSMTPLFLSCDLGGKVHLNAKTSRKILKTSCLVSGKSEENRVLGIASTHHRRTRLIVLVYSNRVSLESFLRGRCSYPTAKSESPSQCYVSFNVFSSVSI
jgi:hypothetical protein